jgi:hypothetical protein
MVRPHAGICKDCPVCDRHAPLIYSAGMAGGGIAIALVMLVLLPVAIMLGGAIWSALMGFLLVQRAESPTQTEPK